MSTNHMFRQTKEFQYICKTMPFRTSSILEYSIDQEPSHHSQQSTDPFKNNDIFPIKQ